MRVTDKMLSGSYLSDLNDNMSRIAKYQTQLASNKRITKPSDDPVGTISVLSLRESLRNLGQYSKNVDDARSFLTISEAAVMDLNKVVTSAYELTLQAANVTQSATEKRSIASELREMRDYIVEIGNTKLGDKYVFGGFNTTTAPFAKSGSAVLYQGIDLTAATPAEQIALSGQSIEYKIGAGSRMEVSLTGIELMGSGDDNLIGIFDSLIADLESNAPSTTLSNYVGKLQAKQDDVLTLAAGLGGKANRLDLLGSRYADDEFNFETLKSSIEDIDSAEIITKLQLAENIYQAALSIGSRILQPSLADFLS